MLAWDKKEDIKKWKTADRDMLWQKSLVKLLPANLRDHVLS